MKPVIKNATQPLTIRVLRSDAKTEGRKKHGICAVANCLYRIGFVRALVGRTRIFVETKNGEWFRYMTPPAIRDATIAYDRSGAFGEGEFTLKPPSKRFMATGKTQGGPKNQTPSQKITAPVIKRRLKKYKIEGVRGRVTIG